jgi:hypothetical protein
MDEKEKALKIITDFSKAGGELFIDYAKGVGENLSDKDLFFIAEQCQESIKDIWHTKYKNTMMAKGVTNEEADDALQAGMGEFDYSEDPEEAALEEMSYWTD